MLKGLFDNARARPAPPPESAPPPGGELIRRELPAQLLRRLEFEVVRRLDGFLFGDYTGLFYGPSLDLAEVREYQPGDEVRRIDWNVTARTGALHVRQYREEREIIAWLIVDQTASMDFGTRRVLKRDAALEFAGVAAAIVTRGGNKVGAVGIAETGSVVTPLGAGRRQALTILGNLGAKAASGGGAAALADALGLADRTLRRRALVFVVSDFLEAAEPEGRAGANGSVEPGWSRGLRRLAQRHDVVAVRISDPAERELPAVGDLRLRDPESGREVWIDTSDPRVRRAHARLVRQRDEAIMRTFRSARVDPLELSTADDLVKPLLRFTLRRRGRRS